jgi:iron complex outermembrane receptor protein
MMQKLIMAHRSSLRKWIVGGAWMAIVVPTALGDTSTNQPGNSSDVLGTLSLEQLVNVKVTSVSKKETDAFISPTAITVITQDDIERNGFTSIPDALRLVPGMDVAELSPSGWAVSARGFNDQLADKLLVLVDGRSVYSSSFGGVFWQIQDLVMEDLDRIEVIRGPGATLWGDNAVDGVINIITKSASETQGTLISTSFGTEEQDITSVRYGGQLATNLFFRVFLKYENEDGFLDSMGNRLTDGWDALDGGARFDWEPNPNDRVTLQGDYVDGSFGGPVEVPQLTPPYETSFSGSNPQTDGNALGRWTHDFSSSSQMSLQVYYNRLTDTDGDIKFSEDTYDVDLQHHFTLGDREDIVWGGGFRESLTDIPATLEASAAQRDNYRQIYNLFGQDDVTLVKDRLHVIVGSKFDHDTYSGFQVQPSGRLLWTPTEKQTAWMAVSRAVTTPSLLDESGRLADTVFPSANGPVVVTAVGNPSFRPEELLAYESGYRVVLSSTWSFDLASYYNVYQDLQGYQMGSPYFDPTPVPHLVLPEDTVNNMQGHTYGVELSAQWKPLDYWRWTASYSWLQMKLEPSNAEAGESPQNQFQIHSYLDLTHNISFNSGLYYVSDLPDQNIPSYFRLDLNLIWRVNKSWELGIFGQNLLHAGHPEFGGFETSEVTEIPRSIYGKVTLRF